MQDITQPLAVIKLKLPLRYWVQVVIWNDIKDLRQHTTEESVKDYVAIFIPDGGRGKCVGVMNLARTHLSNGVRAHELHHMIAHMAYKLYDEKLAQIAEEATNELDKALISAGIL